MWLDFKKAKSLRPLHSGRAFLSKPTELTALLGRPRDPGMAHWQDYYTASPDQQGLGSGFDLGACGHYQGGSSGGGSSSSSHSSS